MKLYILLFFLTLLVQGCASFTYTAQFQQTESTVTDPNLQERTDQYRWSDLNDIAVYIEDLPAGMAKINGEYRIQTESIQLLGKAAANKTHKNQFTLFFKDFSEDEDWRNVYCPVQGVLFWSTFTLWGATPFPWFCFPHENNSEEDITERKMRLVNTLKKTAKASGGNAILITQFGDAQPDANIDDFLETKHKAISAEALILKILPAQADAI